MKAIANVHLFFLVLGALWIGSVFVRAPWREYVSEQKKPKVEAYAMGRYNFVTCPNCRGHVTVGTKDCPVCRKPMPR